MKVDKKIVKYLVGYVKATREDEISCGNCFNQIHEFAELKLIGKSPEEAMPLVQVHLENCHECKEEYETLLEAMKELEVYS